MNIDERLLRAICAAMKPPEIISPVAFAEREIRIPATGGVRPGALRFAPYQVEPLNALTTDADTVVLKFAAQTGKSTIINAAAAYYLAGEPSPILLVHPTDAQATEYVKERLRPLLAASPTLAAIVGKAAHGLIGADSGSYLTVPGGYLATGSSHRASSLSSRPIRILLADEIDRFAISASSGGGAEGDPVSLAQKRQSTYRDVGDARTLLVSTPTTSLGSRIEQRYLQGDQRKWFVRCDCGREAPLAFEDLKWDKGAAHTAHMVCSACGLIIDEQKRRNMVEHGRWMPTATPISPRIRSYHLSELSSLFSSMVSVAEQHDAATSPEQRAVFVNTVLAEVHNVDAELMVSAGELEARAEDILEPYSADITHITSGTDCQSDRTETLFLGHHADGTLSILDHVRIAGATSGVQVWRDLEALMDRTFSLKDGRVLSVAAQAVDGGFNSDQVVDFVIAQKRKGREAYAVIGRDGFARPIIKAGGRLKGRLRVMIVGSDSAKLAFQQALGIVDPTKQGYVRLPSHLRGTNFFESLTAEELRVKYVNGQPRYKFARTHRKNEAIDAACYAFAVNKIALLAPSKPTTPKPTFAEQSKAFASLRGG